MAWTKLTNASGGAPNLNSVNGSLCLVLDWALVTLGWAIEFTDGANSRVYRAATGNRHRLWVRHDSAISGLASRATVRGAESATSATAVTNPFPTVAQTGDTLSIWKCGQAGTPATNVPYVIYGSGTFFILFSRLSATGAWRMNFFGDVPGEYATAYDTVVRVDNLTTDSTTGGNAVGQSAISQNSKDFWARGIDLATLSVYGGMQITANSLVASGRSISFPVMRGGYQNRIVREKIALCDIGSASTTIGVLAISKRAWLPNLWAPCHSDVGGVVDQDTFTDSVYSATAIFRVFDGGAWTYIVEETDTWSMP